MLPFDLERMRNGDLAVQQVADRLRDDRLAVARRAVDEHRVAGVDRRTELIEHALADTRCENALRNALAPDRAVRLLERVHVLGGTARAAPAHVRRSGCAP